MEFKYFSKQIKAIKNFLETDHDHSRKAQNLIKSCENGDIETFKKQYFPDMKLIDHSGCILKTCMFNHLKMFKYLLTIPEFQSSEAVQRNKTTYVVASIARNQMDIVKYVLDEDFVDPIDIYQNSDEFFKVASKNKQNEALNFLLYEKNYQVSPALNVWLKENNQEDALKLIQVRDSFNNLNNKLSPKAEKLEKPRKI